MIKFQNAATFSTANSIQRKLHIRCIVTIVRMRTDECIDIMFV